MSVLLVTGSRSLADNPDAARWTREHVAAMSARVHNPNDAGFGVACGDARGPDTWAAEFADRLGYKRRVFALDGWIYDRDGRRDRWIMGDVRAVKARYGRRFPLERNKALVEVVAIAQQHFGERALCLGLIDPASATNGTRHTLRLARERGIECVEMEWRP